MWVLLTATPGGFNSVLELCFLVLIIQQVGDFTMLRKCLRFVKSRDIQLMTILTQRDFESLALCGNRR